MFELNYEETEDFLALIGSILTFCNFKVTYVFNWDACSPIYFALLTVDEGKDTNFSISHDYDTSMIEDKKRYEEWIKWIIKERNPVAWNILVFKSLLQ